MSFCKLNERSIRLFTATPEELEKKRPHLNAPYFRVKRAEVENLLRVTDGDIILSMAVWKRKGKDGKPDYFTAEITYPDDPEVVARYIAKDEEWKAKNPRSAEDAERKRKYAMNQKAAERIGVAEVEEGELPF